MVGALKNPFAIPLPRADHPPQTLYRYGGHEWLDRWLTQGIVRLGSLHRYRTIEGIRMDDSEGQVATLVDGVFDDPVQFGFGMLDAPGGRVEIREIVIQNVVPNLNILCFSGTAS